MVHNTKNDTFYQNLMCWHLTLVNERHHQRASLNKKEKKEIIRKVAIAVLQ